MHAQFTGQPRTFSIIYIFASCMEHNASFASSIIGREQTCRRPYLSDTSYIIFVSSNIVVADKAG